MRVDIDDRRYLLEWLFLRSDAPPCLVREPDCTDPRFEPYPKEHSLPGTVSSQ